MIDLAAERLSEGKTFRLPRPNLLGFGFIVALIVVWQLADGLGLIGLEYLASPLEIAEGAVQLLQTGALQADVLHTAITALAGWVIGAAIGIVVGIVLGSSPGVWRWSMASFEFLRAIPGVTLAPLAVLLFGFSMQMELVLIAYVATWDVLVAVSEATRSISRERLELARALGFKRWAVVSKIMLPSIADVTLVALRISLAVAIAIAIVAEIVGNPAGIGFGMTNEQNALEAGRTFAYVISAGLLGVVLCGGFSSLTRVILPKITAAGERNGTA